MNDTLTLATGLAAASRRRWRSQPWWPWARPWWARWRPRRRAGLLAAVTLIVGWAERQYGSAGLLVGTARGALADAHAPVAALGALHAAGAIDTAAVRDGALVAVAANSCTRSVTAFVAGGFGYGVRVMAVLAASSAAALAVALSLT